MHEKIIITLVEMGLTRNEAMVYHSILSLGPTSVLKISHDSGIKRSTIYPILNALIDKGLVNIQIKGVKQVFAAENPEKLEFMIERRKQMLKDALPELNALYFDVKGSESFIKHYRGLESIKSLYNKVLSDLSKKGGLCYILSDEQKWRNLMPQFYDSFLKNRAKLKNVETKILIEDSEFGRNHKAQAGDINAEIRLLKNQEKLSTYTLITEDIVIFSQTTPPYIAMTVENKSIIQTNLVMFNVMWDAMK